MLGSMRRHAVSTLVLAMTVAACAPTPPPSPALPVPAPPTATPPATPSASATPSAAQHAVRAWVGDPITVAEAIDHRDHHLDDTELAVEGFAWTPAGTIFCPLILPASPAMARCPDDRTWISDADPGPQTGPDFVKPNQPAIELLVRPDTYAQVPLPPQPARVIALGHFDDHRSGDCPPGAACRRNFLVDAILDPDNPSLDRAAIDGRQIESGLTTGLTAADAVQLATGLLPGADGIVVASPVPGTALARYEPRAKGVGGLTSSDAVWLIRYLARTDNRPVLKTVLVADRSDLLAGNVFTVSASGDIGLRSIVGEPIPSP
jgi:hypothetical protein